MRIAVVLDEADVGLDVGRFVFDPLALRLLESFERASLKGFEVLHHHL